MTAASRVNRVGALQRKIQKQVARSDLIHPVRKQKGAMQAGARRYPEPPMPRQHKSKPGRESSLQPQPMYDAPFYRGSGKLAGKVALITGADSGIGRAVAVLFAREGADVAIQYLSEHDDARKTKAEVEAQGQRAVLIAGDVRKRRFCVSAVARTMRALGKLDVLVNNAAFQVHTGRVEDLSEEHFELDTNLIPRGIRVNAVAPGPVWTPLNPSDKSAREVAQFGAETPMKRPAQPEEIAPAYVFFASAQCSSYITGEILPIIGGYSGG